MLPDEASGECVNVDFDCLFDKVRNDVSHQDLVS